MRMVWLVALAMLAACGRGEPVKQALPATPVTPASVAAAPPAPPPAKLAQIFTPDVLGANVAWLETITGPAFRTDADERIYKVDGCEVIVGAAKGKIDNIGIQNYSARCSFPIAQYFATGGGPPTPQVPTFGELKAALGGRFAATCLRLCGNATDPVVSLVYQGSHADNFNDLYAGVPIGPADDALNAYSAWGNALVGRYGENAVDDGEYASEDMLQDVAAADFAKVRPTIIRVGSNLSNPD